MRYFAAILVLALSVFAMNSPAVAKAGDPAWVQCVWKNAPASANNWLKMAVPNYQTKYDAANSLLGLRLLGICASEAADPLRPGRLPNWKQLASAIKKGQPKIVVGADAAMAAVSLCESAMDQEGKLQIFKVAIVRYQGEVKFTAFEQYFDSFNGALVLLPQDLRVVPPVGTAVQEKCRPISEDGSLIDA